MTDTLTPFRILLNETNQIVLQNQASLRAIKLYTAIDFTPFQFIRWGEVPLTHMLAFFLNSEEKHGQQTAFQDSFFNALRAKLPQRTIPKDNYAVAAEKRHGGGNFGQIDLLLTSRRNRFAICIENKPMPGTADQNRQLQAYREYLTGPGGFGNNYILLYMSNIARPPAEHSLPAIEREELEKTGHYTNLTYENFLLPLLSEWSTIAKPEKICSFLLDFRYQIERQLNFPSTAPIAKMYQEEIAELMLTDAKLLKAAYQLPSAVKAAEGKLREKFGTYVTNAANQLNLQLKCSPEDFRDFQNFVSETPCAFTKTAWGDYVLGLEFSGATLDVGVVGGGKNSSVAHSFTQQLGAGESNDNWAWWTSLYNTEFSALYIDIATGDFATKILEQMTLVSNQLDLLAKDDQLA